MINKRVQLLILLTLLSFSCQNSEKTESVNRESTSEIQSEPPAPNLYDLGVYVTDVDRSKDFYTTVFGLKVVREWKSIDLSYNDENYVTVELHGLYLAGNNGMHLELMQKAEPDKRQEVQQPINHFAIEVEDVRKVYELAISMGAKPAFADDRLQYARIGDFKVLNTQIIGLDGERIQILEVLSSLPFK